MKETDSEMIREAFKIFDRDGNGVITANEFKLFMVLVTVSRLNIRHFQINMGMCFDEAEVEEMMNEVDCDGERMRFRKGSRELCLQETERSTMKNSSRFSVELGWNEKRKMSFIQFLVG